MYDLIEDHILAGVNVELDVPYMITFDEWVVIQGIRGYHRVRMFEFYIQDKTHLFCIKVHGAKKGSVLTENLSKHIQRVETNAEYDARIEVENLERMREYEARKKAMGWS
jgi:hypothetical protein